MPGGIICLFNILFNEVFTWLCGTYKRYNVIDNNIFKCYNIWKNGIENYAVRKYERDNPKYTQFQQLAVIGIQQINI